MVCPKCNSENISIQAVGITRTKSHSIWWWLFVSWWIWIFWILFFIPMLIIRLIRGRKVDTVVHSEAVCQQCGNRWKV